MNHKAGHILTINTGSSSVKFSLYQSGEEPISHLHGEISNIGSSNASFCMTAPDGKILDSGQAAIAGHADAFMILIEWIQKHLSEISIEVIGHRIVHGGEYYSHPVIIDSSVLPHLDELIAYDPLHMESEVDGIRLCKKMFPNALQTACFDTAFHHTIPAVAKTLPLPQKGVRRYGFHGLSYEYVQQALQKEISEHEANARTIIAHLGSGASIAALKGGTSVDTSMAFTSNSGLVMSTRSGDLDPGLIMYLQETLGYSPEQLRSILNKESGLKAISETTGDMKELLEREAKDRRAALAIDIFCYTVKKYIGAYAAVLGGVDTLVFTGGIGERSAPIRYRICQGLEFLGIVLDEEKNHEHLRLISSDISGTNVRVIPTNEELMIARHANRLARSSVS